VANRPWDELLEFVTTRGPTLVSSSVSTTVGEMVFDPHTPARPSAARTLDTPTTPNFDAQYARGRRVRRWRPETPIVDDDAVTAVSIRVDGLAHQERAL